MTHKVTDIDDARILKKMNAPLNLPIERRTFSEAYTKHWMALLDAHSKFMSAVGEYADGPRAGSLGKWRLMKRRLARIYYEMQDCYAFVGEPNDGESEQDAHESALLSLFLTDRAMPFVGYWQAVIEAVEAGGTLTFNPGDIPLWTDD
jgi:hypothetical protein